MDITDEEKARNPRSSTFVIRIVIDHNQSVISELRRRGEGEIRRESIDRTQHQVYFLKTGKLRDLEKSRIDRKKIMINACKEDC